MKSEYALFGILVTLLLYAVYSSSRCKKEMENIEDLGDVDKEE